MLRETSLLPHVNPGVMTREDIAMLRAVSVSQGIMLESTPSGCARKAACTTARPTKRPACGSQTMRAAGELQVPFTTGILIGIGETREERIDALLAIRELHEALRPHPGSHRPELPRQARHRNGRRAGAGAATS